MALVRPGSSLRRLERVRDQLQLLEGDLAGRHRAAAHLGEVRARVCLHLAWYAEPGGKCLWAHENLDCLSGSLAFLRMLHDVGCPRVVLAGTSVEYDTSKGYVAESSPIRPANLYAAAKHSLFDCQQPRCPRRVDGGYRPDLLRVRTLGGSPPSRPFVISKLLEARRASSPGASRSATTRMSRMRRARFGRSRSPL